jgi:Putative peptidoglycan binding domain
VRLRRLSVLVALLALPPATGALIALPAAAPAAASSTCAQHTYYNPNINKGKTPEPVPYPILSNRSTGPCVHLLQWYLNADEKAGLALDGIFGPATLAAVKKFQGSDTWCTGPVDGIAGPHTMSCLAFIHGGG